MPVVDVPWPATSSPGNAPGEGSGRLINCFAYKDGDGTRWRRSPGLASFCALPDGEIRGGIYQSSGLLLAIGSKVVSVDSGANVTTLTGTLPGDGPVTIARNNNLTPTVTISTNAGPLVISSGGALVPYPDGDLPSSVISVAILDGFFIWTTAAGAIWASGLNITDVDPLSNARAEARPDGLLRVVIFGQLAFFFGLESIEVWQDAGALPFPLSRQEVISTGLFGQWAVAGYEDGWAGPLIFVAQDGSVRRLDGYTPTRISNDDLEALIVKISDRTTLRASVYTSGGNAFWVLSSPNWTWEFNVTTGQWNERESYLQSRWRTVFTIHAFGRWMAAERGSLYVINSDILSEGNQPLVWGMDSGPTKQFPTRLRINAAYFDFVLGQAQDTDDPKAMLSWSHDGGATWASPVERSVGRQGVYANRMAVHRLGLSSHHGTRLRFRVSDAIYSSFSGSRIDVMGTR